MNINETTLVFFSPTGTTRKVLGAISEGIQTTVVKEIDLTLPSAKTRDFTIKQDDFAIIGVPVYAGRVPAIAAQRLKQLEADKTPAAIIVVYGNREYEDALLELSELVKGVGFVTVAAGAFIGEHSFSTTVTPIAVGRPDTQDLAQARDFGAMVRKKIEAMPNRNVSLPLSLPGNVPYKDYLAWPEMSPVTVDDLCNLCGQCAAVCPTAAITVDKTVLTDKKKCIICCACVRSCPTRGRVMEEPLVKGVAQRLSAALQERKTPDIFV